MNPVVLVVTGLRREAAIAAGPGILTVAGGGCRAELEKQLRSLELPSLRAVVSFGIAGALDPGLRVGDVLIPTEIRRSDACWPAAAPIRAAWMKRLEASDLPLVECPLLGADEPLLTAAAKRAAFRESGADAVDMESHIAAAFAAQRDMPFGALRVVSDRADHDLPPIAGAAMRPDGSVDVLGVLRSLARDPGQIPALLATARDAAIAFRALSRVRGLLSLGGGFLGLDL